MKHNTTKRKSAKTNPMQEHHTGQMEKSSTEDEFLMRLLRTKTPMLQDPEPQTRLEESDIVADIMRANPGITEDEIWAEIEGHGFMGRPEPKQ